MSKPKIVIPILIVAFIVVGFLMILSLDKTDNADADATQNLGSVSNITESNNISSEFDKVPLFALEDYEGNVVANEDYDDRILVVNSWAVWCPFCKDELPDLVSLQEEFSDEISVIAIDRQESLDKAKGFTDEIGVTDRLVFLLDPDDSFYKSIGGFGMPETIFVDLEGNIRFHKRGVMSLEEMRQVVADIL